MTEWKERPVNAVAGSWTYPAAEAGTMVLSFHNDYTYTVDFEGDGAKDIWGKYDLLRNRIRMDYEQALLYTDCYTPGYYYFNIYDNWLVFTELADQCIPRKKALSYPREKKLGG